MLQKLVKHMNNVTKITAPQTYRNKTKHSWNSPKRSNSCALSVKRHDEKSRSKNLHEDYTIIKTMLQTGSAFCTNSQPLHKVSEEIPSRRRGVFAGIYLLYAPRWGTPQDEWQQCTDFYAAVWTWSAKTLPGDSWQCSSTSVPTQPCDAPVSGRYASDTGFTVARSCESADTLIYAHADTEQKRKAIELAEHSGSPTRKNPSTGRYTVSDEKTLKRLYGLP